MKSTRLPFSTIRNIKRSIAGVAVIYLAMSSASAVFSGTAASFSIEYTVDLEKKHMLLDSIKEEPVLPEKDTIDKQSDKPDEAMNIVTASIENANFSDIMPSAEKINLAFNYMGHTLSPSAGSRSIKDLSIVRSAKK